MRHPLIPFDELAAKVAEILDKSGVPNVLFGSLALSQFAELYRVSGVEFVVPDAQVQSAIDALHAAGFALCNRPRCKGLRVDPTETRPAHRERILAENPGLSPEQVEEIARIDNTNRPLPPSHLHPVPAAHFHPDGYLVSLHAKSKVLWWLPDFEVGDPAADDKHLMLSNDPILLEHQRAGMEFKRKFGPSGPWTSLYPIKVLNPDAFTDAVILNYCRNHSDYEATDRYWGSLLCHCMDREPCPKNVRPDFKLAWDWFNERNIPEGRNIHTQLLQLHWSLKESNGLGPLPLPLANPPTVEEFDSGSQGTSILGKSRELMDEFWGSIWGGEADGSQMKP